MRQSIENQRHRLIEKTLSISDAYKVFLKVGADPEVEKLRRKVERGSKIKHVPALYLATAMALQGMPRTGLDVLSWRIKKRPLFLSDSPHAKRDLVRERPLQFVAFRFSLRSRCEEPRKKDKFSVAALVHNTSARRSLCGHGESYSIAKQKARNPKAPRFRVSERSKKRLRWGQISVVAERPARRARLQCARATIPRHRCWARLRLSKVIRWI